MSGHNGEAPEDFQRRLRQFVINEEDAQRAHLSALWSKPIEERVEMGRCVTGLTVSGFPNSRTIKFHADANDSRFREGDYVCLNRGDPQLSLTDAIIVASEDQSLEIHIPKGDITSLPLPLGMGGLQIDESAFSLQKFYLSAIDDLARTGIGRDRILPLLNGDLKPKLDFETLDSATAKAKADGFDDEQARAIASALATDLCWLIHGPPGTGKTRVLTSIIQSLLESGERILVTAANHRTINHLLDSVIRLTQDAARVVKIAPFPDPGYRHAQSAYFSDSDLVNCGGGYVVGATPFGPRSRRLAGVDFDMVIIDEASQMSIPLAVMAMLSGQRYIFAGDHRQLPPVCLSLPPDESNEWSIFGTLTRRGMDTMLATTHRLNEPLCEWPSETFYASKLRSSASAAGRRFRLPSEPQRWKEILGPDHSMIWIAVDHVGSRTSSPDEVEVLAALLSELVASGFSWSDVGVVVPFRRQARTLRSRLKKSFRDDPNLANLTADTVERMQGQEREMILLSMTASDGLFLGKVGDFLFQPERLNVAATRAKSKFVLVASPALIDFVKSQPDEDVTNPWLGLLDRALRVDWRMDS